ncbi:MAG: YggT family protein [Alphaproteobacteria bacterium]|nr:YggT family protein [Alphaproteobacteria bacterium]MBU1517118.1 YggT family protein [Alphaproteobacteria bacterium]MBU2093737.1 YggT family protein [Alphaproteobacteria bacterium]MBU2153941.1 YggT family protein [Alphaproteobacteria bacterium]MBU2308663.1 YggT family protein [Alphaproteobacteria bacterium]
MAALIDFAFTVLQALIQIFIWAVIASAILSWLVAFNVINLRNQFVYNVVRFLDAVTRPVLQPLQRIIPPLGGIDISPIILILVLSIGSAKLLTPLKYYLISMVSGG